MARRWTPEDGLPSNVINTIYQSDKGYIWVATYNGLARFDGMHFKTFKDSTHPSLSNVQYNTIKQDNKGNLWISSQTPYLIELKRGLDTYNIIDMSSQGPNNVIESILTDPKGRIIFTTRYGVFQMYHNKSRQLSSQFRLAHLVQLDSKRIYLITKDRIGYWQHNQIEESPKIFAEKIDANHFRVGNHIVAHYTGQGKLLFKNLKKLSDGQKLLYTSEGFLLFSKKRYKWIPFSQLGLKSGNDLYVHENHIWLTSRQGTYRMKVKKNNITHVRQITHSYDNTIYRDGEGSFWIGTANKGVKQLVESPFTIKGKKEGLASDAILAVLQDDRGWKWIGTNCKGLDRISQKGMKLYDIPQGMATRCVWSLAETSDGKIWASDRTIVYYDPNTDRFKPPPFSGQLKDVRYRALFEDSRNQLWIGTLGKGIARWDGDNLQYYTKKDGLPSDNIRMFFEDKKHTLWIATEKGIAKIVDTSNPVPRKVDITGDYYYRAIMKDNRGLFWFGSYGSGITIYNQSTGDTTRVTTQNGLDENIVSQIAEDNKGNIWLGGNKGIYVLPKKSVNQFLKGTSSTVNTIAYGKNDGLRTAETSGGFQPSWQRLSNGDILFATVNGLVHIKPSHFQKNQIPPPIHLEQILVGNKTISKKRKDQYQFSYDDRRIQFKFSILSFKNPDQLQVEYKLEGFDSAWQKAGAKRKTTYTSLPPGHYNFKVRAANAYGIWNKKGISIPVTVASPFWQKWWFILLAVFAGGFVIYGFFRLRLNFLRNRRRQLEQLVIERTSDLKSEKQRVEEKNQVIADQNQKLEELNQIKDRFIAGISHEFRTPLTLIFGSIEMAEEKLKNSTIDEVKSYLGRIKNHSKKLKDLVDQFLELSKLEAGMSVINMSSFSLTKFSAGLTAAFGSLAEQKGIDYQIDLPQESIWIEADRSKLEMAINNILKNAFKFTTEEETVTFRIAAPSKGKVTITISDTGRGMHSEEQQHIFERFYQATDDEMQSSGTGIGLAIAKEIVELHDGEIDVRSRENEGSMFTLTLPVITRDRLQSQDKQQPAKDNGQSHTGNTAPEISTEKNESGQQVLVIEDNAELRTFIKERLRDNFIVLEAGDGKQGLKMARRHIPDLIISDVMMPRMDGFTFCRTLRNDPEIQFLPVILLTARASKGDEITGLDAGADDYIQKPFDTKVLRARVYNLIRLRMKLREQYLQQGLPESVKTSETEDPFKARMDKILHRRLADPDFSVQVLADKLGVSRRQLLRKCKDNVGKTTSKYIRHARLKAASKLLKQDDINISEVAYAVGFNNLSLFSKYFKEWKGQSPSSYQKGS